MELNSYSKTEQMQNISECKYNIVYQLYTCTRPLTTACTVADNSFNSQSCIQRAYTQQIADI
jgi:hypothetical protein